MITKEGGFDESSNKIPKLELDYIDEGENMTPDQTNRSGAKPKESKRAKSSKGSSRSKKSKKDKVNLTVEKGLLDDPSMLLEENLRMENADEKDMKSEFDDRTEFSHDNH